jgi:hypothetical protein
MMVVVRLLVDKRRILEGIDETEPVDIRNRQKRIRPAKQILRKFETGTVEKPSQLVEEEANQSLLEDTNHRSESRRRHWNILHPKNRTTRRIPRTSKRYQPEPTGTKREAKPARLPIPAIGAYRTA